MKEKIKGVWNKLKCIECRKEREKWILKDMKDNVYCPAFPGYGNFEKNIDVMLITQGHAGGGSKQWNEKDFEKLISLKKEHYQDIKPCPTFHTSAIRNLIERLEREGKTWYLTDIWKCFIYKDKKNKDISFKYCKNLIIKELEILKPKNIVLFGREVQKLFNKISGKLNHTYKTINSIFPSQWTADKWISKDCENNILDKINDELKADAKKGEIKLRKKNG